jgi:chitinase
MADVARSVDTVNLMTYDDYEPGDGPITGHHAPLFANPSDPRKASADASVTAFEQAGVPANEILLGIPFYGHTWASVADHANGLYQPGKSGPAAYAPFSTIESTMLNHGFIRFWDAAASVPWLYSPAQRTFVSYEDPQSIAAKCKYVRTHHLGGVMFWTLEDDDPARTLLKAIDQSLH